MKEQFEIGKYYKLRNDYSFWGHNLGRIFKCENITKDDYYLKIHLKSVKTKEIVIEFFNNTAFELYSNNIDDLLEVENDTKR